MSNAILTPVTPVTIDDHFPESPGQEGGSEFLQGALWHGHQQISSASRRDVADAADLSPDAVQQRLCMLLGGSCQDGVQVLSLRLVHGVDPQRLGIGWPTGALRIRAPGQSWKPTLKSCTPQTDESGGTTAGSKSRTQPS